MLKITSKNGYDIELPKEDVDKLKEGFYVLCDIYTSMKKYDCDILNLKYYEDESFMQLKELTSLVQGMQHLIDYDIVSME